MNERRGNKQKVQNFDKTPGTLQKTNSKTEHGINMNERKGSKQKVQNLYKTLGKLRKQIQKHNTAST